MENPLFVNEINGQKELEADTPSVSFTHGIESLDNRVQVSTFVERKYQDQLVLTFINF